MNSFAKVLALGAVLVASAPLALADPVTGTATVFGFDTFDQTQITFMPGTGTLVGTGSLAALDGVVTLDSFSYAGANGNVLFSSPAGFFEMLGAATVIGYTNSPHFVDVTGQGVFVETGYAPTPGTFTLSSNTTGVTSFTINSEPNAAVTPEPSSLVLLGTGLIGAAGMLFRRRQTV